MHLCEASPSFPQVMCNIDINDGTFQRNEAEKDVCGLRAVSGLSPWRLVSILFPNYGSVHTLPGNSISAAVTQQTSDRVAVVQHQLRLSFSARAFPVLCWQKAPPFPPCPLPLPRSADIHHQFFGVASLRACTVWKKPQEDLGVLLHSLQRQYCIQWGRLLHYFAFWWLSKSFVELSVMPLMFTGYCVHMVMRINWGTPELSGGIGRVRSGSPYELTGLVH